MAGADERPRIDGARLLARLDELGRIGGTANGGVTRLAYSRDDAEARALVGRWMAEAGLVVHTDAATNTIGRSGPGPAIVLGSHVDTVVDAGRYDGCYGVVAAIEVADALRRAGTPLRHPLVVVAFANEEGARGTVGFAGSLAAVGTPPPLDDPCDDGRTLRRLLHEAGGRPDDLASAAWPPGDVVHYVELHIEQGPVLHRAGVTIGAVTGITGRVNAEVVVDGAANHAGTTPMELRRDAAVAAAHVVLAVQSLATDGVVRVATAGHIDVQPGVRNVVPGRALVGIDMRDLDGARLDDALERLGAAADAIGARTHTHVGVRAGARQAGVPTAPPAIDIIEGVARELGLPTMRLPSGAGHDAQVIAALAPVAMIFVPSVDGVSHSPREHTLPTDLVAGADVLLGTVVRLDTDLP